MHIIGIELIDGKEHIIKNLKKKGDRLSDGGEFNGWYPFCRYNSNEKDPPAVNSSITFDIGYDFYKLDEKTDKLISVSCIVGKNGSGKSSLLELYYRIINNIGFIFKYFDDYSGCDLIYEYGFSAKLFFSILINKIEKVGCFEINNNNLNYITIPGENRVCLGKVEYNGKNEQEYKYSINNTNRRVKVKELEKLFYTVVTNYSMYAFNPENYVTPYYPSGIFHKNDGYVTPIVLLPYRNDSGIIAIENERELAQQRIIALQIFLFKKHESLLIDKLKPLKISYSFSDTSERNKYNYAKIEDNLNYLNDFIDAKYGKKIIPQTIEKGTPWGDTNYNLYYKEIEKAWKNTIYEKYNIDFDKFSIDFHESSIVSEIKNRLIFYLIHKTIKICANYELFINQLSSLSAAEAAKKIVNHILEDKTFITLKIRQCIEYIKEPLPLKKDEDGFYLEMNDFSKDGKNVDFYFLKLPPAIFDTKLFFFDDKNNKIPLSSLSSGELQLLNSFSYVLYHLKNLECNKALLSKDSEINYPDYNNIVITFDEAELYMHPEYQRQFLYKLIDVIYKCNFERINQIQILIATHSPYILSDVPIQNLLMLEEGEKRDNKIAEQTFGANIYDLLKNQFFMTAPVGEIARNKINEIIEFANSDNITDDESQLENYMCYVKNLGDSYLKNTLEYLLKKRKRRN